MNDLRRVEWNWLQEPDEREGEVDEDYGYEHYREEKFPDDEESISND